MGAGGVGEADQITNALLILFSYLPWEWKVFTNFILISLTFLPWLVLHYAIELIKWSCLFTSLSPAQRVAAINQNQNQSN